MRIVQCNKSENHMADETQAKIAAEAPAKVAETIVETAKKVADAGTKTAKRTRTATARRAKRVATAPTARKPRKTSRRAKPARRNARTARAGVRQAAAATQKRINDVNFSTNNLFTGFEAAPGFAPFQSLFADAGERSQEAVRRSQKAAEQIADLARGNVEALVEAGRVAAEGARSLGQDVVARGRDGAEQTADAIRSLAEAKSPTEFMQLQSELAKSSFDRLVAESSRLTESLVKLAGETIQPLSNRATANAARINSFVA
jgi:phasin family protein